MAIDPVLAQAILSQQQPDIQGAFNEGQNIARGKRIRDLAGRTLQEGGGEALTELQGIAPDIAIQMQNQIGAQSQADLNDFVKSAGVAKRMLETGNNQGALEFANQRLAILSRQ